MTNETLSTSSFGRDFSSEDSTHDLFLVFILIRTVSCGVRFRSPPLSPRQVVRVHFWSGHTDTMTPGPFRSHPSLLTILYLRSSIHVIYPKQSSDSSNLKEESKRRFPIGNPVKFVCSLCILKIETFVQYLIYKYLVSLYSFYKLIYLFTPSFMFRKNVYLRIRL